MLGWIGKTEEFGLFFADLQIKGQTLYRFYGFCTGFPGCPGVGRWLPS
jgi:hypothetical protein